MVVLLPQPLLPTRAMVWPVFTLRDRLFNTYRGTAVKAQRFEMEQGFLELGKVL